MAAIVAEGALRVIPHKLDPDNPGRFMTFTDGIDPPCGWTEHAGLVKEGPVGPHQTYFNIRATAHGPTTLSCVDANVPLFISQPCGQCDRSGAINGTLHLPMLYCCAAKPTLVAGRYQRCGTTLCWTCCQDTSLIRGNFAGISITLDDVANLPELSILCYRCSFAEEKLVAGLTRRELGKALSHLQGRLVDSAVTDAIISLQPAIGRSYRHLSSHIPTHSAAELRFSIKLFETVVPPHYESSTAAEASSDDRANLADRLDLIGGASAAADPATGLQLRAVQKESAVRKHCKKCGESSPRLDLVELSSQDRGGTLPDLCKILSDQGKQLGLLADLDANAAIKTELKTAQALALVLKFELDVHQAVYNGKQGPLQGADSVLSLGPIIGQTLQARLEQLMTKDLAPEDSLVIYKDLIRPVRDRAVLAHATDTARSRSPRRSATGSPKGPKSPKEVSYGDPLEKEIKDKPTIFSLGNYTAPPPKEWDKAKQDVYWRGAKACEEAVFGSTKASRQQECDRLIGISARAFLSVFSGTCMNCYVKTGAPKHSHKLSACTALDGWAILCTHTDCYENLLRHQHGGPGCTKEKGKGKRGKKGKKGV